MNDKHMNTETNRGRWLRVGLLALTFLAPIATSIRDYLRKRQEMLSARAADTAQRAGLNTTTIKQLSTAGRDWSYDLLKRGEGVAENVASQGSKLTHNLLERGGQVTHDLTERGGQVTHALAERGGQVTHDITERGGQVVHVLAERGGQVTHDLTERGSQVTHALAERGDQLLQPLRKRGGTFWTVFGFSFGLVSAAVVTFVLLRKRLGDQLADEEEEHIELRHQNLNGAGGLEQGRPEKLTGEILHLDKEGSSVATLQTIGVDVAKAVEVPVDAAFVGVVSTKRYYPMEEAPGESAQDIIYFTSEDEAKAQGYSAAE